jgi:colicin import membrane protein
MGFRWKRTHLVSGGDTVVATVSRSRASKSPPARRHGDPFRLGWRYVPVRRPDGTKHIEQVPLTQEDLLHPKEGDFIVETDAHNSDCLVNWNIPGVRPLGPDVAVFFGVKRRTNWNTFDVRAEHARPALVVEITSKNTRKNDLRIKSQYYHRANVPFYLIADAVGRGAKRRVKLIAHQHTPKGYKLIMPGPKGRIYLEAVRLWVGTTFDSEVGYTRLACFDAESGEDLAGYAKTRQALLDARAHAEAQAQDLANAQAHIIELEAELKRSRGRSS